MTIYNLHHYISKAVSIATPFAISTGISYDTLKLIMELR